MTERALELVLPWPSKDLSPNARVHYRVKAEATRLARQTALLLALNAGWRNVQLPEGRLHLWIDCYQAPGKKLPDDDNMIGRCKAYRDGIAQALGIDDKRFKSHPDVKEERRPGGQVVMRITGELPAAAQQQGEQDNAG
ncbi:hypothetical protein [Stenotrophomonas sp. NPDC078853]|jgi:hypothetical protein|uniref:hypothetical protein n=1 Tax=Stenotrophomonas sp. NPDC078853 TaxID=3364534 RepID=UPI00384B34D4